MRAHGHTRNPLILAVNHRLNAPRAPSLRYSNYRPPTITLDSRRGAPSSSFEIDAPPVFSKDTIYCTTDNFDEISRF